MRKILQILFLALSINSFGQLGNGYDFILDEIKTKGQEYELKKDAKYYYLVAYEKSKGTLIAVSYFFNYDDNVCYCVSFMYPMTNINALVQTLNEKYVKEGELLWKDYASDIYYELLKDKELVFLRKFQKK